MKKVDRQSAKHYFWQEICDGWHLMERDDLRYYCRENAAKYLGGYALP